jgi:hypothetical protein
MSRNFHFGLSLETDNVMPASRRLLLHDFIFVFNIGKSHCNAATWELMNLVLPD